MTTPSAWIGAITIDSDDSDAMRRFYREALGGIDMPGHSQSVRVAGMPLNFRELDGWARPTWSGVTCGSTSSSWSPWVSSTGRRRGSCR